MVADCHFYYKVMGNKARSLLTRQSGFRTKSLFIIILYFFISESLSINTGTILLLLIRLIISIKTFKSRLCSKER
jgi:hypothetical protein